MIIIINYIGASIHRFAGMLTFASRTHKRSWNKLQYLDLNIMHRYLILKFPHNIYTYVELITIYGTYQKFRTANLMSVLVIKHNFAIAGITRV